MQFFCYKIFFKRRYFIGIIPNIRCPPPPYSILLHHSYPYMAYKIPIPTLPCTPISWYSITNGHYLDPVRRTAMSSFFRGLDFHPCLLCKIRQILYSLIGFLYMTNKYDPHPHPCTCTFLLLLLFRSKTCGLDFLAWLLPFPSHCLKTSLVEEEKPIKRWLW